MSRRFWFWDAGHFPRPVSAAATSLDLPAMAAGFTEAARELNRALPASAVRVVRGYVYFGIELPRDQHELAEREATYARTIGPRVGTALSDWTSRYEPEATRLTDQIRALSTDRTIANAWLGHALDRAVHLRARQWAVHDLALVPAMEAATRFTARYADHLGGATRVQMLLQGFPNRQTAAADALDAIAEAIRERDPDAARWLADATIDQLPAWIGDALRAFLREHGHRSDAWDVGDPTWQENPRPVLHLLCDRLMRPASDAGATRPAAATERESAIRDALSRLPPGERGTFLVALHHAQAYPVISEDHNAIIDQQGMAALRSLLLLIGERLTHLGALRRPTDIRHLSGREMQQSLLTGDHRARAAAQRAVTQQRQARRVPPQTFGAPLPAWAGANSTLADFFGLGDEPTTSHGVIQAAGVSTGMVTGRAFVAHTMADLEQLRVGDILVCPMTSPAWTPWFSAIAGAVIETGGMLSHAAILAREFGIPCVVRARNATSRLTTGITVTLDGSDGVVRWST